MAKYDPLHGHLRRQKTATYEMTFPDVERIIAGLLPKSAQRSEWWANETDPQTRYVQCRAWLDAGYNAFLIKGAERVRFERR
ncbi:DUF7662 domain-containing protein [Phenylobacterium sp.]|jgi:hypothetical protein|uniref:DUF7662 domain-containing protein n=1 Tax=Phenylobacterium sp. TaxID=1871053 RepID=UPI002F3F334B